MFTVLVITNLTASSHHALEYACQLAQETPSRIILLHVFSFSPGIAGEGVTMAAVSELSAFEESALQQEMERMKDTYPGIALEARMVAGQFESALREEIVLSEASIVITGTEGDYRDIVSWDDHVLHLFTNLPVPVIVVPAQAGFAPVKEVAFACNYQADPNGSVATLQKLYDLWHCRFHLVHVNKKGQGLSAEEQACKEKWQTALAGYTVSFYEPEGEDVVQVLETFCREHAIDLLAIRPHRHGIWSSLFEKSDTRNIVHLNNIPVLALRASQYG